MSRQIVTRKVTQTFPEVKCDKCSEIIANNQSPWFEYMPVELDLHFECYKSIICDALEAYLPKERALE